MVRQERHPCSALSRTAVCKLQRPEHFCAPIEIIGAEAVESTNHELTKPSIKDAASASKALGS